MKRFFLSTAVAVAVAMSAGVAMASPFDDQIISGLQSQGFERIEIRTGLTQVKVEAIRGRDKVEIIYDLATGAVLSQQTGRISNGERVVPGVESRSENRDFVSVGGRSNHNNHDSNNDDNGVDDTNDDNGVDDTNDDNGVGDTNDDDNGSGSHHGHNGHNGSGHNGHNGSGHDDNGSDNNDDDNGSDNNDDDNGSDHDRNHDDSNDDDDNN